RRDAAVGDRVRRADEGGRRRDRAVAQCGGARRSGTVGAQPARQRLRHRAGGAGQSQWPLQRSLSLDARRHAVASARHTARRRRRAAAVPAGSGGAVGQRRPSANGALRHAAAGPAAGAGGWCAMNGRCHSSESGNPATSLLCGLEALVLCTAYANFKAVSSACRRPSHVLSRAREKVTEERGTPMARPPGILPSVYAGGCRGFPTAPPCAGGKLARIHASHPADFPSPARRAIGAPGDAARSCAQKQQHPTPTLPCMQGREAAGLRRSASARVLASGAHDARLLFRAPSAAVSRGRSGRAAGVAMEGNAFSTGQESGRKARPRLTDFPCMDAREAPPRGGLLFGLLFSWPRKRKVTRAPAGARNRFEARASTEAPLTPTLSPNGQAVGGEGGVSPAMKGRAANHHHGRASRAAGFTLLEVLGALALLA